MAAKFTSVANLCTGLIAEGSARSTALKAAVVALKPHCNLSGEIARKTYLSIEQAADALANLGVDVADPIPGRTE